MDGEHLEQYAGGPEQRARDIQDGSSRSGGELLDDLIASFAALEDAWDAMTADAWGGYGFQAGVQWPCRQLPFFRWREVEVHHVDLGLGYEVRDWPESYVAAEARLALAGLPERITDSDEMASLLGWLLGRQEMPSLQLGPWKPRPTDPALVPGA
jgi:maleylpyruvate isomerase